MDVAAPEVLLQGIVTRTGNARFLPKKGNYNMAKKMLLREYFELCEGGVCQDLLTEVEKRFVTEGGMILSGKMQTAGIRNGNGRIYGRPILEREVKNYQKIVNERRALGELDHPEDSVVNLKNASHMVTNLWWEEDDVMGKVQVLNTPSGQVCALWLKVV